MLSPAIIPLQAIHDATTDKYGIRLFILRTDLNHALISGNKWFKLKYNLQEAKQQNSSTLLTFGGAFSNHIAATAAAGKEYGFKTIGIIRGEAYKELNPTLQLAMECGMQVDYVSRALYRDKENLYEYIKQTFTNEPYYLIPEGGSNSLGVKGCEEITQHISIDFDYVCCACGTGAPMAGITLSLKNKQQALGFQVLKARDYIKNEITQWLEKKKSLKAKNTANWGINEDYHYGGYAKTTAELKHFIKQFENDNAIPLDYVYTGKMMAGIYDLIQNGFFRKGETIVAVHTGGLQGNKGFEEQP
jgi:1-aminocyclopropane-1-carboxylate deaminase